MGYKYQNNKCRKFNHQIIEAMKIKIITAFILGLSILLKTYKISYSHENNEQFFEIQQLFKGHRFPAIIVNMDGSILAVNAGQNKCRISEDGGATWGPSILIGDDNSSERNIEIQVNLDENNGDVFIFKSVEYGDNRVEKTLLRSQDKGQAWFEEEVVVNPDGFGGVGVSVAAESGITLQHGQYKGRLLLPARVYPPGMNNSLPYRPYVYNSAIYSDDGGKTWDTSHPFPVLGTGEGALAELSCGRIYYNSREHMSRGNRYVAWSEDGGVTWLNPSRCSYLPDGMRGSSYGNMGGLVKLTGYDSDILIYSNLDSEGGVMPQHVGGSPGGERKNITVWASFDGGLTWPVKRLVYDGPSAYSSLASGRPETSSESFIYLLFEGGPEGAYSAIQLARFNLEWLLDGRYPDFFLRK